ncbi:hypothetical protein LOK49_LG09G01305 [Camellia lanceoleosa]|uniref:Uncharacterized protein n=1 Tax=Camellia lanceoleosa TaxID=1840588 RepID=A0ACC0GQR5_9ERIC|nr:hypothetical protein LOK49_LG09G01305 [Camellia lanceoleosa]
MSLIYGSNTSSRIALWLELRQVYHLVQSNAWLLLGDFNVVRHASERLDADHLELGAASVFNSCLEDLAERDAIWSWLVLKKVLKSKAPDTHSLGTTNFTAKQRVAEIIDDTYRDYDGKVTPEEVAYAAMYLKDTLGKEGVQELISNLSKDRDTELKMLLI